MCQLKQNRGVKKMVYVEIKKEEGKRMVIFLTKKKKKVLLDQVGWVHLQPIKKRSPIPTIRDHNPRDLHVTIFKL